MSALILLAGCRLSRSSQGAAANSPPAADAGADQSAGLGVVILDGSGSSDPDGDRLSYGWTLVAVPPGSLAALSDEASASPTFDADLAGDYVARLVVNDGIEDSEPDSVTIHVTIGDIAVPSGTIGAGLQLALEAELLLTDHDAVTVRIESSNPLVALVAPDGATPGSQFIDIPVAAGETTVACTVQGVAGADGSVTITASAHGFTPGTGTINVVQPGVSISGLSTGARAGIVDAFDVRTGIPDGTGTALSTFQGASAANVPPLLLTLTSSNGAVGHVSLGGNTGPSVGLDLAPGTFQLNAAFVPLAAGQTTVTASIPGFLTTTSASVQTTVAVAVITVDSRAVGAALQSPFEANLSLASHGGVTVRIESSDPSIARVAPDATTPGSPFIDVPLADGQTAAAYYVQGVAGAAGDVTIAASAPDFAPGNGTVTVVQAGVAIFGLATSAKAGLVDGFDVRIGTANAGGTGLSGYQFASAGNATPLVLTLSSSDGAAGHVRLGGNTAAAVDLELAPGTFQFNAAFVPLAAGQTTVTASIPGFLTTTSAMVQIAVAVPDISVDSRTVGAALQSSFVADLSAAAHGGVTVRIESSNPSVALVAPDAATPGSQFIDVSLADGDATASYVVQGLAGANGVATVTASAPGFASGTGTITVVQPGVAIFGLASGATVGANDSFDVRIGLPNAAGTGLSGFQGASAANPAPLVLTLSRSDGAVGHVTSGGATGAVVQRDVAVGGFQLNAALVPLAAGQTTVTASIPGFLTTTAAGVAVTVSDP